MRKLLTLFALLTVLTLVACGGGESKEDSSEKTSDAKESSAKKEITVGASSVPHAAILEAAKPILAEKGITLNIEEYQDYVLPNDDLASGDLDANYFQHIPFLEQTIKDTGYDLDYIGGVHIEPMAIYSKSIKSVEDIKDGTEVILSNSVAEHGRVLALLEQGGLIKLDDGVEKAEATLDDIVENPKNLTFSPDYEPAFLPELYNTEENTIVAINTNYAIEAGLSPVDDALILEGEGSPYVNVIAVRSEDKDDETLKTLIEVLQSEEIHKFIEDEFEGAVIAVGGND